jgi:hypothetical protein
MWPFKKTKNVTTRGVPENIQFSQIDSTDRFGDNLTLKPDDWIETTALNATIRDQTMGLPLPDASKEEVYRIASQMSRIRENIPIPNDGV